MCAGSVTEAEPLGLAPDVAVGSRAETGGSGLWIDQLQPSNSGCLIIRGA